LNEKKLIKPPFFARSTLEVARDLIDKYLVTKYRGDKCGGRIVETEAYLGLEDEASHAAPGLTERNSVMFGKPGRIYVYLIYGMHYCFNIVCESKNTPGAVLIRAIEPEIGIETMIKRRQRKDLEQLASGPAKLTQALKISISDNGKQIPSKKVFLYDGGRQRAVCCGPRIGISRAGEFHYRFYVKGNRFVSV